MDENMAQEYDPASLPDLLPVYYKRLFPYGPYYRWLSYGGVPKSYFTHREFSFTLADDVYIRYQSFSDQSELEKEVQKKCPHKIDIGAIFSHRPKDHKTVKAAAFQPQEKELVFDIDMTDYDDVRACCSGADICLKCWPLMTIAVKIIDRALREDFGYQHLLWVYSGRRGVHCWVCDEGSRKLSQAGRTAIAEYLSVVKGGENQVRKVTLYESSHPSIQRAITIVEKHFDSYAIKEQDFLGDEEKVKKVLQLVPEEGLKDQLENEDLKLSEDSGTRWKVFKERVLRCKQKGLYKKCGQVTEEIMLQYCYPRLDVNVSKGVNHLLKSPFCVHPKTGRVCVPIDIDDIDQFDPFKVPTISQLCEELNNREKPAEGDAEKRRVKDYRNTILKESLAVFEKFLKQLAASRKGTLMDESDAKKEF